MLTSTSLQIPLITPSCVPSSTELTTTGTDTTEHNSTAITTIFVPQRTRLTICFVRTDMIAVLTSLRGSSMVPLL